MFQGILKLMKNKLITTFFVCFSFMSCCEIGYSQKTYNGQVVSLIKSILRSGTDAENDGQIKYVAPPGKIIFPEITDINGNIVQKGTLLIELDPVYWENNVEAQKNNININAAKVKQAKEQYDRAIALVKSRSESVEQYQADRAAYYTAFASWLEAKNQFIEAEEVLKSTKWVAPYEGIVSKVFLTSGMAAGQPPTLEVTQLNPIGVKIKMARKDSQNIDIDTPITIYPSIDESQPIGVIHGSGSLTEDGIMLIVHNEPIFKDTIKIENKVYPVVLKCHNVLDYYITKIDDTLGVAVSAIKKDTEGNYYVWKAVGIKNMQPGKGIKNLFPIKKVYIKPANTQYRRGGYSLYRALLDPGELKQFDIVVSDPPQNVKDGNIVFWQQERYILMPGDEVRVEIGN
jgi:hypothetical protein